jgi:hypothetical protein
MSAASSETRPTRLTLDEVEARLWTKEGVFSLDALHQLAAQHLPQSFRSDWATDIYEKVTELTDAGDLSKAEIASMILNDIEENDGEPVATKAETTLAFPRLADAAIFARRKSARISSIPKWRVPRVKGQLPAIWVAMTFIVPRQTRLRVLNPALADLMHDYLDSQRRMKLDRAARVFLAVAFTFRTVLFVYQCICLALASAVVDLVVRPLRGLANVLRLRD